MKYIVTISNNSAIEIITETEKNKPKLFSLEEAKEKICNLIDTGRVQAGQMGIIRNLTMI